MKSGFFAIVGRPSAGKSTLMNALCGGEISITSAMPQTTRTIIRGIVNAEDSQIVFLDTPGYHESEKKLNTYLKKTMYRSLDGADAVLYIVDASRPLGQEEQSIITFLKNSGKSVIAAVNKIDKNVPRLDEIRGYVISALQPVAILSISAEKKTNLDALMNAIIDVCPEGTPYYPEDYQTDQTPSFRISEIIRGEAIRKTREEVPHSIYVHIEDIEFDTPPETMIHQTDLDEPTRKPKVWVRAVIMVESRSQVGILVGTKGTVIKSIRIESLKKLKKAFSWKISLDLRVKVNASWRKNSDLLKRLTFSGPEDG